MEKFTKEQLIARARENIRALECFPVQSIPQMDLELARIALAALTAPQVTDAGEHFQRGYDEGHSRGLTCGKLYKSDDEMRQYRAACMAAYRAEINGEECDE